MELFLSPKVGAKEAGMDGHRPLLAAKTVSVLHGLLFQAQESEKSRLCSAVGGA